jgi:hypothetical protein
MVAGRGIFGRKTMKRMMIVAGFVFASFAAGAAQQTFPPDSNGLISFVTPTANIGCAYAPKGGTKIYVPADGGPELSCDRVEPSYLRFILGRAGKAKKLSNVGDPGCCSAGPKLSYGNFWKLGLYKCVSSVKGLTCTRGTAHGFFISKAKTKIY